jgi:hypothetical protein
MTASAKHDSKWLEIGGAVERRCSAHNGPAWLSTSETARQSDLTVTKKRLDASQDLRSRRIECLRKTYDGT